MTRKKGPSGPGPGPGSGAEQHRSPNAATLPGYLDPAGAHGDIWVAVMKPAVEGEKLPTNPFSVAKSIQSAVGTIHSAWRNKDDHLVIKVRGEPKFKKLLRLNQLLGSPPMQVVVEEHNKLNRTKVVVTCRSVEGMTDEELTKELEDQGVVEVRRFQKAGKPTNTMTVTVRGTVAPEAIYFGFERCKAKPYTQAPMQCYRCYQYGHTKLNCRQEEDTCRNCSTVHKIEKDGEGKTVCSKPPKCLHCNGAHSPASRICDQYREEEEVIRIRSTLGKSPREARLYVQEQRQQQAKSFAKVAAGNSKSVQDRIAAAQAPTEEMKALQEELVKAKKDISATEELRKELAESRKALKTALRQIRKLKKKAAKEDEGSSNDEMDTADDGSEEMPKTETKEQKNEPTKRTIEETESPAEESNGEGNNLPFKIKINPQPEPKKAKGPKEEGRKDRSRSNSTRRSKQ